MATDYNVKNYDELGGARTVIGGEIDIVAGGKLKIAGVDKTAALAAVPPEGVLGVSVGYKLARGQAVTVTASDDLNSGLARVIAVIVSLDSDPVDGCMHASASVGDQAGAPAAGHFYLKTWKSTDGDATLIPATTFGKAVNWIAIGQ